MKIQYHLIVSLDIYKERGFCRQPALKEVKPKWLNKGFRVTEDQVTENKDIIQIHRKYVGIVSAQKLIEIAREVDGFSTCDTMGAITLEFGWLPAIAWQERDTSYDINIYVSPIAEYEDGEKKIWDSLSETQKKLVENRTSSKLDEIMEALKDEEYHFDNESYPDSVEFHPEQVEMELENATA